MAEKIYKKRWVVKCISEIKCVMWFLLLFTQVLKTDGGDDKVAQTLESKLKGKKRIDELCFLFIPTAVDFGG